MANKKQSITNKKQTQTGKKKNQTWKKEITVVNIVVSTSLEHAIPLEKMAATLSNTEYNPEQFPGLVYKLKEAGATFLLFRN